MSNPDVIKNRPLLEVGNIKYFDDHIELNGERLDFPQNVTLGKDVDENIIGIDKIIDYASNYFDGLVNLLQSRKVNTIIVPKNGGYFIEYFLRFRMGDLESKGIKVVFAEKVGETVRFESDFDI